MRPARSRMAADSAGASRRCRRVEVEIRGRGPNLRRQREPGEKQQHRRPRPQDLKALHRRLAHGLSPEFRPRGTRNLTRCSTVANSACASPAPPMWMTLGALELLGEQVEDQFQHILVEHAEGAVDQDPGRHLDQDARKGEAQLLVLAQLPLPAARLVEHGREPLQPEAVQGPGECRPSGSCRPSWDRREPPARCRAAGTACRAAGRRSARLSAG